MTFQFSRYAVGFHVEDHDGPIDAPRRQEVALAVEAHAGCVPAAQAAGCGFGVVLGEDEGVGE
jgi:hypothetical protein